ncbi:MAG: hypothetical protein II432_07320, partial [Erysipelotrichaceae bacterium]|nr:hypothetical protein [Erysipelotrichaceae bacterium]
EMYLFVEDEDHVGHDVWGTKSDEEIKKIFESDGCDYYTKEEMIDFFWNDHQRIFECMDKAMVWMDTNLADSGVNWKK